MINHEATRKAYPNAVTIDDGAGVFDADGNHIQLDQAKVDAAAVIVAQEQALESARRSRQEAFAAEADPLFFQVQRGEADQADYDAKVIEIRQRYPYPSEAQS